MDSDADLERTWQVRGKVSVHDFKLFRHGTGRIQRLAAGVLAILLQTEERHDAIPDKLVKMSAVGLNCLAHMPKILVDHEHDVIGQFLL